MLQNITNNCLLARNKDTSLLGSNALKGLIIHLRNIHEKILTSKKNVGKEEIIVLCDLSPVQAALYQYLLSLPDFENAKFSSQPCDCADSDGNSPRYTCCRKYLIPLNRSFSSAKSSGLNNL